jgi:glycosyltransferase involved in cell wall biosynthesis
LKILFIQPYVSFGGVISDTLPGHLAERGYQVEMVSYARNKEKMRLLLKEENIRFHSLDALSISVPNFVTEFPYFLSLDRAIQRIQPDIVHINNLPFLTTFQSARLAKRLHKKSVVHIHGVIGERGFLFDSIQEAYIFTFGHSVFNNANRIICLTNRDAQKVCASGCPPEKIRVIVNGVDVRKFHPSGDEVPNSLLWCGRFVQQKGLKYLIEAMRILVKENKDSKIKLRMTGDGPLLSSICQMVKSYGLEGNVIFMGLVPRRELSGIISKASLYVLPSLDEGMPYVLLETMACGKAVIGSDIPGISDVISQGKNGILVPPKDPEALARTISQLLNDKNLRKKLGSNARKLMIEKYSWNTVIKSVEEVYREAIQD